MKKLIKLLTILGGLIVILAVAGIILVTTFIDPNQFKPLIISQFKQFTGFEMTIPGKLSWSFYPNLGMEAEEVTITDAAVFNAKMKNLVLRAKFEPLLHKQFEFSKASIKELQLNNLQLYNVQSKVNYQNQILSLDGMTADLYQGHLNTDAVINLTQASPDLHLTGNFDHVNIAGLIAGLSSKAEKLSFDGMVNADWDVTTQGKVTDELLHHLNGSGKFTVSNGVMRGVDLSFFVNTAAALINKETLPTRGSSNQTEFGQITGTVVIKDGVAITNDLTLDSDQFSAKATGSMDLASQTIDYHVDVSSKLAQKSNTLLSLYGKTVPVRITGSVSDPSVSLDTLALMREVGKEQLERVGQQIQKAIPEKANNFIKSLFH